MHSHDHTFYGLHEWHNYMFEKLGWMAKAQKHGNDLKIASYKDSITRLMKAIEEKIKNMEKLKVL